MGFLEVLHALNKLCLMVAGELSTCSKSLRKVFFLGLAFLHPEAEHASGATKAEHFSEARAKSGEWLSHNDPTDYVYEAHNLMRDDG